MTTTIVPSSVLGPIPGATGGATQGHLVYAAYSGRWWFFTFGGVLDSGTATGAGQSTAQLVDNSKSWTSSQYLGASCILTGGTGVGQVFEIGANTSNTLPVQNNGSPAPPQPGLGTAPVAGSTTYQIVETRNVRAYVSSSADLSTATWSLASGSPTPNIANSTGIDMSGGENDSGREGEFPTDGRLLAVGYAAIGGQDVVLLLTQQNLHWQHITCRGRLGVGSPTTVAFESTGPSTWEDRFPGNECPPTFLQALAVANSNTGRWHSVQTQNTFDIVGYPSTVIDSGLANMALSWGGTRVSYDTGIPNLPWQAALAQLSGGFMLSVYGNGTYTGTFGAGSTAQTGLRYAESSSESLWPTTNVGASIPGLSSASQHPNDWGMVGVNLNDVHVVRRNSATTIEHVRYSGHGGSWGSVVTLPSAGLTGHFQGSGLPLVTDGTSVWCFAIDTDANNSVRYIRWTAVGGWDSSWSTLPTTTETKEFLTATIRADAKQIGVAWTTPNSTGFSGPPSYQVNTAALLLPDPPVVAGVGFTDPALSPQLLPGSPYAYMLWRPQQQQVGLPAVQVLQQSFAAGLGFFGSQPWQLNRPFAAGLSFAGSQPWQLNRALGAALSFTGSPVRNVAKGFSVGLSFAGSIVRAVDKNSLSATLNFVGSLVAGHLVIQSLSAALSFTASHVRTVQKGLGAGLSFAGGLTRSTIKAAAATLSFTVSRTMTLGKGLAAASLGLAGNLTRGASSTLFLSATLSFAGSSVRTVQKKVSAGLSFTGSRKMALTRGLSGALGLGGAFQRAFPKALAARLSFAGSVTTSFILGGSHVAQMLVNFVFRNQRLNWPFRR